MSKSRREQGVGEYDGYKIPKFQYAHLSPEELAIKREEARQEGLALAAEIRKKYGIPDPHKNENQ